MNDKVKNRKRTPLLAGNWKMNKAIPESVALVESLKKLLSGIGDREILVCPTFLAIGSINELVKGTNIRLGAQNMFWEESGAFTGEISGAMLKTSGCQYVILGHSERRQFFAETDAGIAKKLKAAFAQGLVPIVCVGETLEEREAGKAFSVIETQVREGLKTLPLDQAARLVIAYEPVWAIGTGKTATSAQAQEMHAFIRKILSELGKEASERIRILYGGSVKPDNVDGLMQQPDIDGALVGGASLKAEDFARIVKFQS